MENLRHEVDNIEERIYELQQKSNTLTNGQRFAAINEIEKSIHPLMTEVRVLQQQMYHQKDVDNELKERFNTVLRQINDLENIKSDLNARISTESEHIRDAMNTQLITYLKEEITPLKDEIHNNTKQITLISERCEQNAKDLNSFKLEIEKRDNERQLENAQKYDKLKWVLTGVIAMVTALGALFAFLQPTLSILKTIFFG